MILPDTSVWIEHARYGVPELVPHLFDRWTLSHAFVIGELALGGLDAGTPFGQALARMPRAVVLPDQDVIAMIGNERLSGSGIGYVDAHLLAAARADRHELWTLDRKLARAARRLGVAVWPTA